MKGVTHILSFLTNNGLLPAAVHTADAPTLDGLVIDGFAFTHHILERCAQVPVAGGEYEAFCTAARKFFQSLGEMNVPCVVILDGCQCDDKMDLHVKVETARVEYFHQAVISSRVGDAEWAPVMLQHALVQILQECAVEYWVRHRTLDVFSCSLCLGPI